MGGNKEAPKEHEIHLCFVGEKNHLVLILDHQKFLRGVLRRGNGSIKGKKGSGEKNTCGRGC